MTTRIKTRCCSSFIVFFSFIVLVSFSQAAEPVQGVKSVGFRAGLPAGPKHEVFHLYEVFAEYGLPWEWRSDSGWGVSSQVNMEAGALTGGDDTGFLASLGPSVALKNPWNDLDLVLGISFNLIDKRRFGHQDFGSILLYGAYIGANYRLNRAFSVDYRLVHLSNGHLFYPSSTPNPGLDLHLLGISWLF